MTPIRSMIPLVAALCVASTTAAAQGANPFTRANALAKLGASKPWSFFALATRVPAGWTKSSMAAVSDPNHLTRLQAEDRGVPTGWMFGKQQYYKHPVFALLWLRAPANNPVARRAALEGWTKGTLKNLVVKGNFRKWPVTWQPARYLEYPLAGGRRLAVLMLVGASRPSAYVAPLAISLVAAMVVERQGAAVFATGLASDNLFNGLSAQARQRVMKGAGLVSQQAMSAASLARIRLPGRHRGLERTLARRGRFLHASRYASSVGTLSTSSFAQYRVLDVRFHRGQACTIRDDFSSSYTHTRRSLQDAPGADPRRTQGAGGGQRRLPKSRYEVRRGKGGSHWLVVFLPATHGGPTFYPVAPGQRRRCGRKTIRGLAIGGKVEGLYSTFRGWCVHKAVGRLGKR